MPYLTSLSIRISRKFQLARDDWFGVDALATVAVEDDEAHLVDPADIRRMAREQAMAAVREQIAEARAERAEQRQRRAATQQPADSSGAAASYQPPSDPAEAEQRFFARYSETVGGQDWSAVQRYLRSRAPKPTTIEGWIATAEAIRDRTRTQAA